MKDENDSAVAELSHGINSTPQTSQSAPNICGTRVMTKVREDTTQSPDMPLFFSLSLTIGTIQ